MFGVWRQAGGGEFIDKSAAAVMFAFPFNAASDGGNEVFFCRYKHKRGGKTAEAIFVRFPGRALLQK